MSGIQQMLFGGGNDTEIVGVATWSTSGYDTQSGYNIAYGGTITDGLFAPCGGARITSLQTGGLAAFAVALAILGEFGNSGFETVKITNSTGNVTVLQRNDANYSSGSGATNWSWGNATGGEFGNAGTIVTVVFN